MINLVEKVGSKYSQISMFDIQSQEKAMSMRPEWNHCRYIDCKAIEGFAPASIKTGATAALIYELQPLLSRLLQSKYQNPTAVSATEQRTKNTLKETMGSEVVVVVVCCLARWVRRSDP